MGISSLDVNLQWLHRNGFPEMGWPCLIHIRNFYQNSGWEMAGFWRFWTYPLVLLDHVKNQYTYQPLSWHDLTDKSWEFKSWQSLWIEHSFLRCPDRFANWTDRRAKESSRYDAVSTVLHSASQDGSRWIQSPLGGIIFSIYSYLPLDKDWKLDIMDPPKFRGSRWTSDILRESELGHNTAQQAQASKTRNWSQSLDNQRYQRNVRK